MLFKANSYKAFQDLKAMNKRTGVDYAKIVKKLSFDAWNELILRSAFDTGYLRSKWNVVVNKKPPNEKLNNPDSDGDYPDAKMPSFKVVGDEIIIFYNNTAYAVHLEYGTPHMQAQPMVKPTAAMVRAEANRLCKALSKVRFK